MKKLMDLFVIAWPFIFLAGWAYVFANYIV